MFIIFNTVRIKTIDRILFPEYKIEKEAFLVYRKGYPFRESGISLTDLPVNEVKNYMEAWYDWTQEEFLLIFNQPCTIEPTMGWAMTNHNKLIYYSLGVSRTLFLRKPKMIRSISDRNSIHLPKAISLRDTGEENYFHFYNDVLCKIYFLRQHGIPVETLPLIVSAKLWEKEYLQFFLSQSPFLEKLNWIIQGTNQFVKCDTAIFCKPLTHRLDLWRMMLTPFTNLPSGNRKIFLTRNKVRLRFIENMGEIEGMVRKAGFIVVDTDTLRLEEQISLFSNAEFIVGIHGAGLTNMVFRNGNCRILEIFPPPDMGYLPYHYIMLAKMWQFRYRAIIGKPGKVVYSGGFYVKSDELWKSLTDMELTL